MREKLIELLYTADELADKRCDSYPNCDNCPADNKRIDCMDWLKADCLLSLGVTIQEWIPVTERLPENDYRKHWKERHYYLVRLQHGQMRTARYGYKKYDWWVDSHDCVLSKEQHTEVTHWMPLPEPPKGE